MSIFETASQSKALGSMLGMSNPLMLGIGVGLSGLNAYSSMSQAGEELGYINDQISGIEQAGVNLEDAYGQKVDIANEQYGEQLGQASYGTVGSMYDIMKSGESLGMTGLYSGSANKKLERARDSVRKQFGFTKTGLENILGEKIMGLEEWKAGQESDLASQMEGLKYQKKQAQSRTGLGGFVKSFLGA